ncbi:DUF2497 domain-containing protein [Xanthobacter sp. V0B-10]|uniref:DUF2497 domain-containing protein n=1 Tax=Xanthobacter albus TaxID=3119929 RepID=UPI00372C8497
MEEILDSIRRIIADDDPAELDLPHPQPMMPVRRGTMEHGPSQNGDSGARRGSPTQPHRLYGRAPGSAASAQPEAPRGGYSRQDMDDTRFVPAPNRDGRSPSAGAQAVRGAGLDGRGTVRPETPSWGNVARGNPPPPLVAQPAAAVAAERSAWSGEVVARGGGPGDVVREVRPAAFDGRAGTPAAADARRSTVAAPVRAAFDLPPVRPQANGESAPASTPAVHVQAAPEALSVEPSHRPIPNPAPIRAEGPAPERRAPLPRKDLLSPAVDAAVATAFKSLGDLVLPQQERTVEDLVKEILRPMLKEWLDQNLAGIVERLVRAEIERVTSSLR